MIAVRALERHQRELGTGGRGHHVCTEMVVAAQRREADRDRARVGLGRLKELIERLEFGGRADDDSVGVLDEIGEVSVAVDVVIGIAVIGQRQRRGQVEGAERVAVRLGGGDLGEADLAAGAGHVLDDD
jgi:hypothetical protein